MSQPKESLQKLPSQGANRKNWSGHSIAAIDGPAAHQAAEVLLEECERLKCDAAIDVEIENELRRLSREGGDGT